MLKLSTKCWNSAFNAQGSRLIIVVVQVVTVKIYVAAVEALKKKERQDETQFTIRIDGFWASTPYWMLMYFFCWFSFYLTLCMTLCMTKLGVLVLCFSYFTHDSNVRDFFLFHLVPIIMVDQSQAVNSILFFSSWRPLWRPLYGWCWTMFMGPNWSFMALTLHLLAIVVNAVRTRVLLQSFPLSQRGFCAVFFLKLSCCAPITSHVVSVRRSTRKNAR
jgi:hypothetical protein